ncbi:MAG TPA: T9SS type A sorting domain-containing protein [Flavobacteriaceae bacterium]|nr:T9SS type A sorting domain-containing protein [Flavobacteriaceae bacterium]
MKTKKIKNHLKEAGLLCILFAVFPFVGNAQRTVNATGGSANISGNLYAYSIGEMVLVGTESSGTLVVTQGVLQAEGTGLGIEEETLLAESLKLYPNPVANTLYLQPNFPGSGELSLKLFDLRGRLIMQQKADLNSGTERQQMDLSSLQEGTYLLQASLQQGGRSYDHSFKILKRGDY